MCVDGPGFAGFGMFMMIAICYVADRYFKYKKDTHNGS